MARKEPRREQKFQGRQYFPPPALLDDYELAIEASQASICSKYPSSGISHTSFPLSSDPYQNPGEDSAHEADLLNHLNHPVYGASNAAAVFARLQE